MAAPRKIIFYLSVMKKFSPTKLFNTLENVPTSYSLWLVSFLGLIATRMLVENWLDGFPKQSVSFFLFEFSHTFLFFLFAYLLFLPLLTFFARVSIRLASNISLFGFFIILTPPFIDRIISHGKGLWSFYIFDSLSGLWQRFFTFFGDRPDMGITYGVRFEVAVMTIVFGYYVFTKTHQLWRSLLSGLAAYTVFFILGVFPSFVTIAIQGFSDGFLAVDQVDIAAMFLSPPLLFSVLNLDLISSLNIKMSLVYAILIALIALAETWHYFPVIFKALIQNLRLPQMIYHGGLLCVGMLLAIIFANASITPSFFNILAFTVIILAVEFAWLASVVVNDFFDYETDVLTNSHRPLPTQSIDEKTYKALGWTFFVASLLFALLVHPKTALFLVIYQALAWIYSAWPLRLKRFPIIATFTGAIAGILILLSGFILVAPSGTIEHLPVPLVTLLILAYTVVLPLKDFKDIDGDRHASVYTLPVLLGELPAKLIIGGTIFFSYIISVFVLHEPRLFFSALLCGSLSFWIIFLSQNKKDIWLRYSLLPAWILGLVAIYGSVLTWLSI